MKLRLATLSALLLQSFTALASPQGSWPPEARNVPVGRPTWVLVVPATRSDDGLIKLWDKQDSWTDTWVVPKPTPGGIRTVAITGDSEDQKLVRGEQLDHMGLESLHTLARKYGAEAVAVVVRDSNDEVAVAAWKPGREPTWEAAPGVAATDPRGGALAVIDALFAAPAAQQTEVAASETETGPVKIIAERLSSDGVRMEYRIQCTEGQAATLGTSSSLQVTRSGEGTADVLVLDGREIDGILREIGLPPA